MCCYRSRLVFNCCFVDRATNSRVHHLTLTTPLPAHTYSAQELHQQGTAERAYLWASAKWQWLPEQFDAESQVSCYRVQVRAHASVWRTKTPRVDLSSTHEEANVFLTQQASILPKKIQNQQSMWFLMTLTCSLCYSTSTGVRSFNQQWLCSHQ